VSLSLALLCLLLVAALFVAAVLLWRERGQRRTLLQWFADPTKSLPDGRGQWRDIFSAQQRLVKAQRNDYSDLLRRFERYRLATEVLPDGVLLLDSDDRIEWLNATAAEHLGIDRVRDLGTLVRQLLRQPEFFEYLRRFRAQEELPAEGVTLSGADSGRTLSVCLLRFDDKGTLMVSRDISAIVRTDNMRRDFVANVSHELRTPATVISGFLEQLLGDDPPEPEQATYFLRLMAEQAQRMNRLVEDLLTLSRLESDGQAPKEEAIDMPALVESLRSEAEALSAGRQRIELGPVSEAGLTGSLDELRSAFGNLVANAVRYTPDGGVVTLSWLTDGKSPVFVVADSGIGIAREHIPRLTERFYRVDKGRSAAAGGTGLGLAIVKRVLTRHQGTLAIESELGRGSRFLAYLPSARLAR
jgi:two-component system phosphate regulon sensor histidine kinase PhoR